MIADNNPPAHIGVASEQAHARIDALYRSESRRVFATLVRLIGDFDVAEIDLRKEGIWSNKYL